nr:adapter molecule Crk isoform X8 [Drosophila suzukii]
MDPFDVSDRNSWYFGPMSRQEATEVLMNERERGVFLVRDSNSIAGDYVLCVRNRQSHHEYSEKIQKLATTSLTKFNNRITSFTA